MRLVLMGDFHFSSMENGTEEMKAARDRVYAELLDRFLDMEGDYHISLGDLTHEGLPEEFEYVFGRMNRSERHFIHVLGNHDTYSIPKTDILAITGQERCRAIETEEAVLIFLDSTKEMNKECWGGEMDLDQLEWLEEQLVKSGEKPALVFAHHPVYGTTTRSTMDKLSIHPSIDMKAVLHKKKGPGFYFCGHNHANSIVRQEGWHYIMTAACLDYPAYRTVHVENGHVSVEMVPIGHPELAEQIARFHRNMKGFTPSEDFLGVETDWRLQINLLESVK
ncbi:metallophosphoesterase [Paenibacillus sp. GD4]|uniref:metallophosphoesterase family protein n=1 Tax=Paenibacillus sp. GD4 TaxID=3068890 RepID=UPI00279667B7|nr:metallophosphoesterase [Paenibacillus sp. GD4]MDQ1911108.1 metallophosphoesterase [Paenibacillus sp. GD4]